MGPGCILTGRSGKGEGRVSRTILSRGLLLFGEVGKIAVPMETGGVLALGPEYEKRVLIFPGRTAASVLGSG